MEIDVTKLFDIREPQPELAGGVQLVGAPSLSDAFFHRSVVQLVTHRSDGTMGFVVNRSFGARLSDVMPDYPNADTFPVYCGGPVGLDSLFILHRFPSSVVPEADPVGSGLWLGGNGEALRELIESGAATPAEMRFIVGYSGWSDGQLEEEIAQGAWAVLPEPLPPLQLFRSLPSRLWGEAVERLGKAYAVWRAVPELAILN